MQAFICCTIVPNGWIESDVATAMNLGVQQLAKDQGRVLGGMSYSNTVLAKFNLRRQDI
jgi:hypothetical protein